MEFSRQEYWSGLPFPFPGDHPHPGSSFDLLNCRDFFFFLPFTELPGKPIIFYFTQNSCLWDSLCTGVQRSWAFSITKDTNIHHNKFICSVKLVSKSILDEKQKLSTYLLTINSIGEIIQFINYTENEIYIWNITFSVTLLFSFKHPSTIPWPSPRKINAKWQNGCLTRPYQ